MYCPTCGSDNQFEARFCRRCGTGLEAVSLALSQKGEDGSPVAKSQLSQLMKNFYSGRHEMMGGMGTFVVGIGIPATFLVLRWWGFFWIFVWMFMGLIGGGIHKFNKGWKKWNEASCDLKAMGYDVPPKNASPWRENNSGLTREPRTEPIPLSVTGAPPSVTESTTRHLDIDQGKIDPE